eukprot:1151783-Pelagomonas_calceolata.AAC.1
MASFRVDGRLVDSGQGLPAKLVANVFAAPATASHAPLTLQDCLDFLFGRVSKVSGQVMRRAGQGSQV